MKNNLVILLLLVVSKLYAQNVGVGTNTPSEKLQVTGNINLEGNLKINGVAGQSGQVLVTNDAGNTEWTDISGYKRNSIFTQSGSWVVPAGVTKISIQAWGAGGGGAVGGGGGSGSFMQLSNYTVAPGNQLNITIGNGGAAPTASNLPASAGGLSSIFFTSPGFLFTVPGGLAANPNGPGAVVNTTIANGDYLIYVCGNPGEPTTETYHQYSSTDYMTCRQYGHGGDPTMVRGLKGGRGHFAAFNNSSGFNLRFSYSTYGGMYGGGGGGGSSSANAYGSDGGRGAVIIYY